MEEKMQLFLSERPAKCWVMIKIHFLSSVTWQIIISSEIFYSFINFGKIVLLMRRRIRSPLSCEPDSLSVQCW